MTTTASSPLPPAPTGDDWSGIADFVAAIAPSLGRALDGPLEGVAVSSILKALGLPPGSSPQDLAAALKQADYATLAKLKAAETEFRTQFRKLGIDLDEALYGPAVVLAERSNFGDWIAAALAGGITLGFFVVIGWLLYVPETATSNSPLLVLLGALGGAWGAVVNYYFGSSAGGQARNRQPAQTGRAGSGG